jgi:hypothetical protein
MVPCGSSPDALAGEFFHWKRQFRNFATPTGFELVDETGYCSGGMLTMVAEKKAVLPVTVFTDYI